MMFFLLKMVNLKRNFVHETEIDEQLRDHVWNKVVRPIMQATDPGEIPLVSHSIFNDYHLFSCSNMVVGKDNQVKACVDSKVELINRLITTLGLQIKSTILNKDYIK